MAAALVQNTTHTVSSGATSISKAFASNVAAGNLLTAMLGVYKAAAHDPSFSGGGTWTRHVNHASPNAKVAGGSAENATGGATTVQASWSGGSDQDTILHIQEWSGAVTASAFDKSSSADNSVTDNVADSGSTAALAQADELVVGFSFIDDATLTVAELESMTLLNTSDGAGALQSLHSAYRNVSATTAVKYRADWSGSFTPWGAGVMTFKNVAVALEFEGFRFRNDDGSEATATWKAAQDTDVTANSGLRIRTITNVTADPGNKRRRLKYRKVGDDGWRDL